MNNRRHVIVLVLGLLVFAGAGYLVFRLLSGKGRPEQAYSQPEPLPTLIIETSYPGANARVVADTVAAPIEQQINGVEDMLHMRSQSANDGSYSLVVTFRPGVDLNIAQVLVQNRVSLAVPVLPDVTKRLGINVRKETVAPLLIATLSSPGGRYGELYLCNYANLQVKDQLARLQGVGRVRLIGPYPNAVPQKDEGLLERGPPVREGFAILRGMPVAALVVSAIPGKSPRDVCAAIQAEMTQVRARLPEGLALDVVFDSTPGLDAAEYLGIDVDLPDSASMERTENLVRRCGALMAKVGGRHDVLALSEDPFRRSLPQDNRAFLLVRLAPADNDRASRESIMQAMRAALRPFPGAVLRLRDLAAPGGDYPVRLALHTTAELGVVNLQATADALVKRLSRKPGLTDVFTTFRASVPSLQLEIDRKEAARLGVALDQIEKVLRSALRSNQHRLRESLEVLRARKVTDGRGQMVPLTAVVRVREVAGPPVISRFDLGLMAEITANLAPGVSLAEARAQCEEEARTALPKEYRLTWLSETP